MTEQKARWLALLDQAAAVWHDDPEYAEGGRDKCEFCLGVKGGVNGNENVYNGVVVCDYCSVVLKKAATPPLYRTQR